VYLGDWTGYFISLDRALKLFELDRGYHLDVGLLILNEPCEVLHGFLG
jgi:hypothetical protein